MGKTLAPKWNIIFLLISAIYLQTNPSLPKPVTRRSPYKEINYTVVFQGYAPFHGKTQKS